LNSINVELEEDQKYSVESNPFTVKKEKKYSATTEVTGIKGNPYTGYFAVIFLDENMKEIERKIHWLNDFSGIKKNIRIIFKVSCSNILLAYRINSETDILSKCKYALLPIQESSLEVVSSSTKEFFHSLHEYSLPRKKELTTDQEQKIEQNLVWIFSSHRSGSTWLSLQLLSYKTKSINELHISSHLATPEEGITDRTIRRIDQMKNLPSYFFSNRYKGSWLYYLKKLILNRIFSEVNEVSKKIIIKEPGGVTGASDVILQCLPKSKIIALIRDGRDVLDSFLDARQTNGFMTRIGETPITSENRLQYIKSQSKVWVAYMEKLLETYNNHPKNLRYLVKYEDLLSNTNDELKKIYEFIEIDISDEELQKIVDKFCFKNIPPKEKGKGKFIRSATSGKWKENFTTEEIKIMTEIMQKMLKKLGY